MFVFLSSSDILISSVQCGKLTNESKEILGAAGELAQARCVKLINVRAKVGDAIVCSKTSFKHVSHTIIPLPKHLS